MRFRPPAAADPAGLNRLAAREARLGPFSTEGPATPADVVNFGRVQDLPLLLGAALSLLALLTMTQLLLTSVRRRRRDFAVLRAPGCIRGQVRGAVSWQASALTGAALCLGIPAGVLGGWVAWRVFAAQLGILRPVVVPLVTLAMLAAAALAAAVAIAAIAGSPRPGRGPPRSCAANDEAVARPPRVCQHHQAAACLRTGGQPRGMRELVTWSTLRPARSPSSSRTTT